jgi:hypothetical protein
MDNTSTFDLNTALHRWLESLAQSPQFRPTDLAELESHIRDSVSRLETQGLSSEESFLIATRRVGAVEKLEPEFAKVNRSPKRILIHLLILAFFSVGCWFLWAMLKIAPMIRIGDLPLPAFTTLLVANRLLLIIPPMLAAAYCLWAILRRSHSRGSWIGFFACVAGVLMLLTLPVIVALVLPLNNGLNHLSGK